MVLDELGFCTGDSSSSLPRLVSPRLANLIGGVEVRFFLIFFLGFLVLLLVSLGFATAGGI
jgi:hypothetical protein